MKLTAVLAFILFAVLLAGAQTPPIQQGAQPMQPLYSGASSMSSVSSLSDCMTVNCWDAHAAAMNARSVIAAGGKVVAVDASGYAWVYSDKMRGGTNTWTKQTAWGSGLSNVEYAHDGNVYALLPSGSCSSGWHPVGKWTGSSWSKLSGNYCFTQFDIAHDLDGLLMAVDGSGNLWNGGSFGAGPWAYAPTYPSPLSSVAVAGSNGSYLAVKTNTTLWKYDATTSTLSQLSGAGISISVSGPGSMYLVGTDHNPYYWSGSAWVRLAGSGLTQISRMASGFDVWAAGALSGGNTVYRMSEIALQHVRNLSGTTYCPNGPCPGSPVYHIGNVQAGWKVNGVTTYGTTQTTGHVLPASQININATANLDNPFPCFMDSAACSATGTEQVSCSQEGQLVNEAGGFNWPDAKWAIGSFHATYVTINPVDYMGDYQYTVRDNCDLSFGAPIISVENTTDQAYDVWRTDAGMEEQAICFDLLGNGNWFCPNGQGIWYADDLYMRDPPVPDPHCTLK